MSLTRLNLQNCVCAALSALLLLATSAGFVAESAVLPPPGPWASTAMPAPAPSQKPAAGVSIARSGTAVLLD